MDIQRTYHQNIEKSEFFHFHSNFMYVFDSGNTQLTSVKLAFIMYNQQDLWQR